MGILDAFNCPISHQIWQRSEPENKNSLHKFWKRKNHGITLFKKKFGERIFLPCFSFMWSCKQVALGCSSPSDYAVKLYKVQDGTNGLHLCFLYSRNIKFPAKTEAPKIVHVVLEGGTNTKSLCQTFLSVDCS